VTHCDVIPRSMPIVPQGVDTHKLCFTGKGIDGRRDASQATADPLTRTATERVGSAGRSHPECA